MTETAFLFGWQPSRQPMPGEPAEGDRELPDGKHGTRRPVDL